MFKGSNVALITPFKNDKFDISGYTILRDRNAILAVDTGNNPGKSYSQNYQSGALSFEFFFKNEKSFFPFI